MVNNKSMELRKIEKRVQNLHTFFSSGSRIVRIKDCRILTNEGSLSSEVTFAASITDWMAKTRVRKCSN